MASRLSGDVDLDGGIVAGKRRRTKTSRFEFESLENEEQRMLQQALKISKLEHKRTEQVIPEAPTFYPTEEEFGDALAYIRKIRPEAEAYGICKIVPPKSWKPTCNVNMDNTKMFQTRLQPVNTLQEGQGFDDGKRYTISSYKEMADRFYNNWMEKHHKGEQITLETIKKDYWDLVETNNEPVSVEYGNDINTSQYCSGFPSNTTNNINCSETDMNHPDYYANCSWNLNNMPSAPGSLLHFLKTGINGINVPWLYVGMLFASFCWHTEDNFFYSINYSHFGAVKQWYGVPGTGAEIFEKVSKDFFMGLFRETPDILHHMTTQISPKLLIANKVPVYQAAHEPGTFIVTFPRSYHGGFSCGFNCGEAVNFATIDWLHYGDKANNEYRVFARASVFSHQRLLFTLYHNIKDLAKGACAPLLSQIIKIIDEEVYGRTFAIEKGVKDLSNYIKLPPNDFTCIDDKATNYDDMRCCHICKQACIFTAIGCECDRSKVGCLRHFPFMCKCAIEKKFLLAWASTSSLKSIREEAIQLQKSLKK